MSEDKPNKERKTKGEDDWLWRKVAETVTPLPGRSVPPAAPAGPETRQATRRNYQTPAASSASRFSLSASENQGKGGKDNQPARAAKPGLDRRSEERLRRGKMPLEGEIDLHGLTQKEAQAALTGFILRAYREGKRCVLVITGKGLRGERRPLRHWTDPEPPGVLKRKVPAWLAAPPLGEIVLRAVPAKPHHGGHGALYVLIRRKRT